eukprot:629876-Prymnesium_polylepis.1
MAKAPSSAVAKGQATEDVVEGGGDGIAVVGACGGGGGRQVHAEPMALEAQWRRRFPAPRV